MLKFFILLILTTGSLFATPREEAQEILTRFAVETDVTKRLDKISNIFVGLPYGKNGPLGEGPTGKYDQDPLYRFDTFDCTTYVETIMALALSRDVNEFESHLNLIRYKDGEINYLTRNHFTDLQWIPFNIEAGYLQEINHEVVKATDVKVAEAVINFGGWLLSHKVEQIKVPLASSHEKEKLLAELHAEAAFYSPVIARVSYIEISLLVAQPGLLNKIPNGSLVNFVRPNWDLTDAAGTHQNISHQGFLFRKGKVLYLRHASTSGKVEELPFIDYLRRFLNHSTLKGVHLMKMNQAL